MSGAWQKNVKKSDSDQNLTFGGETKSMLAYCLFINHYRKQ